MPEFNAAFWKWFGDSKVVDEHGEPLVVYHGTPSIPYNVGFSDALKDAVKIAFEHVGKPYPGDEDVHKHLDSWSNTISEFSRRYPNVIPDEVYNRLVQYLPFSEFSRGQHSWRDDPDARVGFFFTPNRTFAAHFTTVTEYDPLTQIKKVRHVGTPYVYAVYLRVENPIDLTDATKKNAAWIHSLGLLRGMNADDIFAMLRSTSGSKDLQIYLARGGPERLLSAGVDGIINKVYFNKKTEIEIAVFDPTQIKSATGNDGTWDSDDPDIRSNPEGLSYYRFVHKDGVGLMNNQGIDRSKLSDDEEAELVEVMDFGLQQPRDVPAGSVFAFTAEGVQKHERLLTLLTKASRKGVRELRLPAKDYSVVWKSNDGQVALRPAKE